MAAAAVPLMLAGGAVGAYSSIRAGNEQAKAMNNQADALLQEQKLVAAEGVQKVEAQRRAAREVLGAQRTAVMQNLGSTYGSAADILAESATMAELDTMNIEYETATKRAALVANANELRRGAKEARTAGMLGALGMGLSAGAQAGYMSSSMPKSSAGGVSAKGTSISAPKQMSQGTALPFK